jgi:hypothetical protein
MESARVKLDPQTVDAIARRVIELLQGKAATASEELVDAAELARRLGVDRSWVYTHAIELRAVKLGQGPRPRLRFDPRLAAERIRKSAPGQDTKKARPTQRRRAPHSPRETGGPSLLPIKGNGAS